MSVLLVVSVLYGSTARDANRLIRAVACAAERLTETLADVSVRLALGDCGSPGLDIGAVSGLGSRPGLEVTYKSFGSNLGHSAGCNELAFEAGLTESDPIVFLNPDALPEASAFVYLVSSLSDPNVGVVDARQIPLEHPKEFDPVSLEQSWASGACLGVRAGVFRRVGGFDSDHFWSYCNDVDLSWRVRMAGLSAVHVPQAVVFHDKRMDPTGEMVATESQDYFSTLGRLFLADRYGRPEIGRRTRKWIEGYGSASHRQALRKYEERVAEGSAPAPLPGAASVATFVGGEYAHHRY